MGPITYTRAKRKNRILNILQKSDFKSSDYFCFQLQLQIYSFELQLQLKLMKWSNCVMLFLRAGSKCTNLFFILFKWYQNLIGEQRNIQVCKKCAIRLTFQLQPDDFKWVVRLTFQLQHVEFKWVVCHTRTPVDFFHLFIVSITIDAWSYTVP